MNSYFDFCKNNILYNIYMQENKLVDYVGLH